MILHSENTPGNGCLSVRTFLQVADLAGKSVSAVLDVPVHFVIFVVHGDYLISLFLVSEVLDSMYASWLWSQTHIGVNLSDSAVADCGAVSLHCTMPGKEQNSQQNAVQMSALSFCVTEKHKILCIQVQRTHFLTQRNAGSRLRVHVERTAP